MLCDTYVFMLTLYWKKNLCYDAYVFVMDYALSQVVESLRRKTEGRWFDSRWFHLNFSLT